MILINNETDEMSCKSLDLSSFLFLLYNFFTGESKLKWILADSLRLSRFPPICFLIKHHCTNGLYYFTWTEMFNSPKNKLMKCTWLGIFCTCFYVGCVTRLKVSNRVSRLRLVQENFVKRGQVLNVSFWKKKKKKRGLRKAKKEKILFGKRFPKYIFLLFGACYTIVFQLDAVRFAIERIGWFKTTTKVPSARPLLGE